MKNVSLRIIAFILCLIAVLSLAACGEKKPAAGPSEPDNGDSTENGSPNDTDTTPSDKEEVDPNAPQVLEVSEFLKAMTSTPYTSNIVAEKNVGVSDSTVIGIDKESFDDILYPAPADSECAHVIDVADYGITPEADDCSDAFATLLAELVQLEGTKKVVFPAGVYRFSKTIIMSGLKDVYFCTPSESEMFEILMTKWVSALRVSGCENIHFNDFAFDYETSMIVTGEVVSSDPKQKTVVVDMYDEFDLSDPRYNGGKITNGAYIEYMYDEITGKYVPNPAGNILTSGAIYNSSYDASTGLLTLKLNTTVYPEAGTRICANYTGYNYPTITIDTSSEVYVENVRVYVAGGMAFVASSNTNMYINRFQLTVREDSRILMSATADGFHSVNCLGDIIITNSVFTNSHDDCMNIKSWYGKVASAGGNKMVFVNDRTRYPVLAEPGDVIEFYDPVDFRFVAEYVVESVDAQNREYTMTAPINEDLSGKIFCTGAKSPKLTVKNCLLGNKRNRGMLVQCREVEISNCTFQNIVHGPIQIFSVMNEFNEGIMPRNVVVKNNKFIGNGEWDIGVFVWGSNGTVNGSVLKNVSITNNYFANSYRLVPVCLIGAADITVNDNLFYNIGIGVDPRSDDFSAVLMSNSTRVCVNSNMVYFEGESRGFSVVREGGNKNSEIEKKMNGVVNLSK